MNFIETFFGIIPDNNNGSAEIMVLAALVLALMFVLRLTKARRNPDARRIGSVHHNKRFPCISGQQ